MVCAVSFRLIPEIFSRILPTDLLSLIVVRAVVYHPVSLVDKLVPVVVGYDAAGDSYGEALIG